MTLTCFGTMISRPITWTKQTIRLIRKKSKGARVNPQPQYPSKEDQDWFDRVQQGIVGLEKPKIVHIAEPPDPYSYKRRRASERLGVTEDLLNDEPDNDAGSGEQAYA